MTTQPLLFPEPFEARKARIDQEIQQLLLGTCVGPYGLHLEDKEKEVLRAIRYMRGIGNAIPIREVQQRTGLDPRQIKNVVRILRINFQLPIGSSKRGAEGGYYLILDDADRAAWVKDVLDQVRAELAVLKAAAGRQAALDLVGQLQMDMNEPSQEVTNG